jgi:hypothetical protein
VQVDPIKSALKAPGTKHLELTYDGSLSHFAFNFNLRRYSKVAGQTYLHRHGLDTRRVARRAGAGADTRPLLSPI